MASTYKTLGQSVPASGVLTTLYTVPSGVAAIVSLLNVANEAAASGTFRVSVAVGGAADNVKQYLKYDEVLAANSSTTIRGVALAATDVLRVQSSSGSIAFNAMGVEVS